MVIKKEEKYRSKIMNHLGLIAGMTKELEIANVIDSLIEQDMDKRTVSLGKAVEAMVLNGLGFVNTRLYLVTKFFENKPVVRLLGPGIKEEHLNDDVLHSSLTLNS
jgi:transposase